MEKITEVQFDSPGVNIEIFKGFNKSMWEQESTDPTKLYFFFLDKDQAKTWQQAELNMIGLATKDESVASITEEYAIRVVNSIWNFDKSLIIKGITDNPKGFQVE